MKRVLRGFFVVAVNVAVLVALLAGVELYFRLTSSANSSEPAPRGLWQKYQPYVMFATAPGSYTSWTNKFTGQSYPAHLVTNALGFNDPHEFDYTKPYQKAANERVVLFTGGSAAWGVGATSTAATVAGRMQHYLNTSQDKTRYTVINLAMAGYIAYQQYIALGLWGAPFDPDWVVAMDGFNDAGVGCGYSQGVGNPMYHAISQAFITDYLFSTRYPVFYRGWIENELIKYSATYRALTGRRYIPDTLVLDSTSSETEPARRAIVPTKIGQSRDILAFYLKAEQLMVGLFPKARYILSTQPSVNQFSGDFVGIYDSPPGSDAHRDAMTARDAELEAYLTHYQDQACTYGSQHPAFVYTFIESAIQLERLVDKERADGRDVSYYNVGTLFPDARDDRMPYFADSVHLSDKGADAIGRFYAEKILAADAGGQ